MKKGEKMSEEQRIKTSSGRRGKCIGNQFAKGNKSNATSFKKGITPWIKGKKHSDETRKKMSENGGNTKYWLGKDRPVETRLKMSRSKIGSKPWNTGKKWSAEMKKKLSEAHIGKMTGEANNLWRGGITPIYECVRTCYKYRQWRSDVFTRDGYTCTKCGDKKGGNLNAYHIKPFAVIMWQYQIKTLMEALVCEELWNINNGRTLCITCHKETDTYGKKKRKHEVL